MLQAEPPEDHRRCRRAEGKVNRPSGPAMSCRRRRTAGGGGKVPVTRQGMRAEKAGG